MSSDLMIEAKGLGKAHHIYEKPHDRLLQFLFRGRKRFYKEFWALNDASFSVYKGETVGVIGRNGAGKSTLLQILAGTLTASTGQLKVNGRVAALLELGSGFDPEFTGRENVFLNGTILGISHSVMRERFNDIVLFSGISEFIDRPVKTYSSGMMMRLAFAVSLHVDADIIIIDEALAVGDMAFQFKCYEQLDKLSKSGASLFFVSHDVGLVRTFCDRAIYLEQGNIKSIGTAEDVTEQYLMDVRALQKMGADASERVQKKVPLNEAGVAFGSMIGDITECYFADSSHQAMVFKHGEKVEVVVKVRYGNKLSRPRLSFIVQTSRLLPLVGYSIDLPFIEDDMGCKEVSFDFMADMANGKYFIALRLENALTKTNFELIEKQVSVLSMDVLASDELPFLGLVKLPFSSQIRTIEDS